MASNDQVPVHFVIGTGRCGSTLMHEILCRHPDVMFVSNLSDRVGLRSLNRWNGALYRRLPPSFTRKGRLRFAPSEAYRVMAREVSPILENSHRDLVADDATPWQQRRLRAFFEAEATGQRGTMLLHKFTGWPRAAYLRQVYPNAKFVHVVRDGRAVANSWLQMPWWTGYLGPDQWQWSPLPRDYQEAWDRSRQSFVVLAGLAWMLLLDATEAARVTFPDADWLDVRYEDLLARPRDVLQRIRMFLGLGDDGFDAQVVDGYHLEQGRTDAFRSDLGDDATGELTTLMAEHLERYGYAAH